MAIVTLGIDLAKNVFALHGVDATGKAVLVRPNVPRARLLELVASLPPCLVGRNRNKLHVRVDCHVRALLRTGAHHPTIV